jgi:hypothetical protein
MTEYVTVDVSDVVTNLNRIADRVPDEMVDALNKAAFQLRKRWRETIASAVKQPTAFTLNNSNVVVDQASTSSPEATIRVGDLQARYLKFIVRGLKREGTDIAGVKGQILTPVKARLNRSGDFPSGPPRWVGKLKANVPKGEILKLHGQRAVYEQMRNGHLKLLAVFKDSIQYKESVPLIEVADMFSSDFVRVMNERIDTILK